MTELELGDDLLKQIETTSGKELREGCKPKFDSRGTLHILKRDEDGKLLDDVPIKEIRVEKDYVQETVRNYTSDIERMHKQNQKSQLLFIGAIALLAICCLATVALTIIVRTMI